MPSVFSGTQDAGSPFQTVTNPAGFGTSQSSERPSFQSYARNPVGSLIQSFRDRKKLGVEQPGGPGNNYLGINRGAKDYAAQTQAALARRDFEEFNRTFLPLLDRQLGTVDNPNYLRQQVAQSRDEVQRGLTLGMATRGRQLRAFGVTPDAEQTAIMGKGDKLRASLADVSAINRTSQQVKDRDLAVLMGSQVPNRSYNTQTTGG